jgi:hypothetical protein
MLSAVDSFVTYLSTALGSPLVLPVAFLRQDANNPQSDRMQMGALNVRVLLADRVGSMESIMVSLDILGNDARQAWGWAEAVQAVLAGLMIPEYDFSDSSAIANGRCVSWNGDDLSFQEVSFASRGSKSIANEHFVHLNLTMDITHQRF